MKRFLAFLGILSIVLTIGYLEPVFFPAEKSKQAVDEPKPLNTHTALPYEELKATGFASYIGTNSNDFIAVFGEPKEKIKTNMNYELWLFGKKDQDYIEVNVKDEKIAAIKAFGNSQKMAPFSLGMNLSDVSELMTIYSNFSFTYKENNYNIELMEEDMNYRPLVAFDNKTFAILFFSQGNSKLSAVTYLDKETLLTLMPYELVEGQPLPIIETDNVNSFDGVKSNQTLQIINLLRVREGLSVYGMTTEDQKTAQKLYETLTKKQKNILAIERIENWQFSKEEANAAAAFTLTNDEFQKLLKNGQVDAKKATGMYTEPVYDPTFTVLSWFSDSLYHSRFGHDEKENIGVAFSKANMLVLIQENEKEIAHTEESEEK
ncbi:CAP-associated domain-containing protein [Enterococcus sp. UD-01]|jgi:hypothetical protein|uniref:CAP-associated domain-containing protein n=1 Tax=Enterococcus sp. UD-01 TaxID=3373911 RepID=UPI003838279A